MTERYSSPASLIDLVNRRFVDDVVHSVNDCDTARKERRVWCVFDSAPLALEDSSPEVDS